VLTALDFPDELLYSQDAIWVKDGGVGSARLGLHSFAALDGAVDVVLVKLPKAGARIEKGRPFGHVDLGSRTIELRAPVSGSVLFANKDLRDEPSLLACDPFGQGFLLEVEGVEKRALNALMDRDEATAHFSRFDPEGGLTATQLIEPGRPFASRLRVEFGGRALVTARLMPPQGNEAFTPDWAPGDSWLTDVKKGGLTRRFRYEVMGDAVVAQEEVVSVRRIETARPGGPAVKPAIMRTLHFRVADWTLAAWDVSPADDPQAIVRSYNPRGRECWLSLGEAEDGFVCDHPRLTVGMEDEARDLPKGATKAEPETSHYVKFRGGQTRIEAELRADIPREDGRGFERLMSLFVIERGAPWWREATRLLGTKELVKATLVEG